MKSVKRGRAGRGSETAGTTAAGRSGVPAAAGGAFADDEALSGFSPRQRELLEAALKVMNRKGYEGSRTREIAEEAGVSEATLFKHFPTKRHLLSALMRPFVKTVIKPTMMGSVRALIRDNADAPLEKLLREIMRDRLSLFRTHRALLTTLMLEAVRQPDLLAVVRTEVLPEIVDLLGGVYARGRERGELAGTGPDGMERLTFIRGVLSLLLGYIALSELSPEHFGGDAEEKAIDGMLGLLLKGAARRKGEGR